MAMFRRIFQRRPPQGLVEIADRVFVFNSCFSTDALDEDHCKSYISGVLARLQDILPDASFMVFNFCEVERKNKIADIISEHDITVMDYPCCYGGCPLLTIEMIHHFLRSSESWLSVDHQNVLLMHCEQGDWLLLAFILAALLIYTKQYTSEEKTLDMIHKQAPAELLQVLSLNPMPSQLRYLQYVSRSKIDSHWPPVDRFVMLDCVILHCLPNIYGGEGWQPVFHIYGRDPLASSDKSPKVLFSTPKKDNIVQLHKEADCDWVKIDILCYIQGDVVIECINLDKELEREQVIFRAMFNTAFINSNVLLLNRDEIDILWNIKNQFSKDFRAEILFSTEVNYSCSTQEGRNIEFKKDLPIEAFDEPQETHDGRNYHVELQVTLSNGSQGMERTSLQKLEPDSQLVASNDDIAKVQSDAFCNNGSDQQKTPSSKESTYPKPVIPSTLYPDLQVAFHLPYQLPKILSQRILGSSPLNPTYCNSLLSSPSSISRYNSNSSALGITALLHDHGTFKKTDVNGSPKSPVTSYSLAASLKPQEVPERTSLPDLSTLSPPSPVSPLSCQSLKLFSTLPSFPPPTPSSGPSTLLQSLPLTTSSSIPLSSPRIHLQEQAAPDNPCTLSIPVSSNLDIPLPDSRSSSISPPICLSQFSANILDSSVASSDSPKLLATASENLPTVSSSSSLLTASNPSPLTSAGSAETSATTITMKNDYVLPLPCTTSEFVPPNIPPPPAPLFAKKLANKSDPSVSPSPALKKPNMSGQPPPPPPPPLTKCTKKSRIAPGSPPPALHFSKNTDPSSMPPPPLPKPCTSSASPVPVPPPPLIQANLKVSDRSGVETPSCMKGQSLTCFSYPKNVLSAQPNTKKTPLKPLHWIKVTRAMQGSLWAEQRHDESSKPPEFDMKELEILFSSAIPSSEGLSSGDKSSRRSSLGKKSDRIHLVDLRRANNCEIMLTRIKMPLSDLMCSVLALDDSVFDVDQVDNLLKFFPTKEEMELLKGFNGDKGSLGKCEQFFLEMMEVPRVEMKLQVFAFKMQFHSKILDLSNSLRIVNSASEEIQKSVKLKRIMKTILSLGNALNQGTARGSAVGFRLDSLLKLTDTRSRNNKMTLMHYLCKLLLDKMPEVLDFPEGLVSLEMASKIQLKTLAEDMQAINNGLDKVANELNLSQSDGPISQTFHKTLKEFLVTAEAEARALNLLYTGAGRNADALSHYFGEDPARCPFEQVVSTLLNFKSTFLRAHEENCKQLEFERKKAQKEAEIDRVKVVRRQTPKDMGSKCGNLLLKLRVET